MSFAALGVSWSVRRRAQPLGTLSLEEQERIDALIRTCASKAIHPELPLVATNLD